MGLICKDFKRLQHSIQVSGVSNHTGWECRFLCWVARCVSVERLVCPSCKCGPWDIDFLPPSWWFESVTTLDWRLDDTERRLASAVVLLSYHQFCRLPGIPNTFIDSADLRAKFLQSCKWGHDDARFSQEEWGKKKHCVIARQTLTLLLLLLSASLYF